MHTNNQCHDRKKAMADGVYINCRQLLNEKSPARIKIGTHKIEMVVAERERKRARGMERGGERGGQNQKEKKCSDRKWFTLVTFIEAKTLLFYFTNCDSQSFACCCWWLFLFRECNSTLPLAWFHCIFIFLEFAFNMLCLSMDFIWFWWNRRLSKQNNQSTS